MKKKMTLLAAVLTPVIVAVVSVLVWPLSFSNVLSDQVELRIVITEIDNEIKYDNGQVNQLTRLFVFEPDSTEFSQIQQILDRHSYHRSFRTFFSGDQSILFSRDENDRYCLDFYSEEGIILTGQTSEIKVNSRVHSIGYFGNRKAFSMMDEVKSILDASAPSWENNLGVFPKGISYR